MDPFPIETCASSDLDSSGILELLEMLEAAVRGVNVLQLSCQWQACSSAIAAAMVDRLEKIRRLSLKRLGISAPSTTAGSASYW